MKVNKYFWCLESLDRDLVYDFREEIWKKRNECNNTKSNFSCYGKGEIKTFKAAKSHIRRHNEIPKGTHFRVVSQYIGFDRYIIK